MPETWIAIPDIIENKWFKKGFKFYVDDDKLCNVVGDDYDTTSIAFVASFSDYSVSESDSEVETRRRNNNAPLPRPPSLNAFDIISFSPGFDLLGLFEEKRGETRFVATGIGYHYYFQVGGDCSVG